MKPEPMPIVEVSHVEFANAILTNRRSALALTVDQIQDLAGAIIILHHDLVMAQERAALMLAEAARETQKQGGGATKASAHPATPDNCRYVYLPNENRTWQGVVAETMVEFVRANDRLVQARYTPDENKARQSFEKNSNRLADLLRANKPKRKTT